MEEWGLPAVAAADKSEEEQMHVDLAPLYYEYGVALIGVVRDAAHAEEGARDEAGTPEAPPDAPPTPATVPEAPVRASDKSDEDVAQPCSKRRRLTGESPEGGDECRNCWALAEGSAKREPHGRRRR